MTHQEILAQVNSVMKNTLMETLEIEFTEMGSDFLKATMPVGPKVFQPAGLLHGGATAALAESVGSTASHLFIDNEKYEVRGIEITANHLKSKRSGVVTATAKLVHKGRTIHIWEVRITDEQDNLISLCKMTNIILEKRK